jgi:enamine deaminase RidA (YjgF/YER057c/UK114 family)
MRLTGIVCAAGLAAIGAVYAQMPVKHIQTPNGMIASAVWVGDTLYVGGQPPTPVTPADPAKGTAAVYGDTKAQTLSVLTKIEGILKEQGLTMGDVVMMHIYVAGDPANSGKPDFAGVNSTFRQFFGTSDQPNKPARSAMQVVALPGAGVFVEIEAIAVKSK